MLSKDGRNNRSGSLSGALDPQAEHEVNQLLFDAQRYSELGGFAQALRHSARAVAAVDLASNGAPLWREQRAVVRERAAEVAESCGSTVDALVLIDEALSLWDTPEVRHTREAQRLRAERASLLVKLGRWDDALGEYGILATWAASVHGSDVDRVSAGLGKCVALLGRGDVRAADRAAVEAIRDLDLVPESCQRELGARLVAVAAQLEELGSFRLACELVRVGIAVLGPEGQRRCEQGQQLHRTLARLLLKIGQHDDGLAVYFELLEELSGLYGAGDARCLVLREEVAWSAFEVGRLEAAEELLNENITIALRAPQERHLARSLEALHEILLRMGRELSAASIKSDLYKLQTQQRSGDGAERSAALTPPDAASKGHEGLLAEAVAASVARQESEVTTLLREASEMVSAERPKEDVVAKLDLAEEVLMGIPPSAGARHRELASRLWERVATSDEDIRSALASREAAVSAHNAEYGFSKEITRVMHHVASADLRSRIGQSDLARAEMRLARKVLDAIGAKESGLYGWLLVRHASYLPAGSPAAGRMERAGRRLVERFRNS